jgi:hypothetical protein
MSDGDHMTMSNTADGAYLARCANCGRAEVFTPPMSVDAFFVGLKRFEQEHAGCQPGDQERALAAALEELED